MQPTISTDVRTRDRAFSALAAVLSLLAVVPTAVCAARAYERRTIERNEASALESIKALIEAEDRFRKTFHTMPLELMEYRGEGEECRYGRIAELTSDGCLTDELARGVKDGYRFEVTLPRYDRDMGSPTYNYWLTATPVEPGVTGERFFLRYDPYCQAVFARTDRPFVVPASRYWKETRAEWPLEGNWLRGAEPIDPTSAFNVFQRRP